MVSSRGVIENELDASGDGSGLGYLHFAQWLRAIPPIAGPEGDCGQEKVL